MDGFAFKNLVNISPYLMKHQYTERKPGDPPHSEKIYTFNIKIALCIVNVINR